MFSTETAKDVLIIITLVHEFFHMYRFFPVSIWTSVYCCGWGGYMV